MKQIYFGLFCTDARRTMMKVIIGSGDQIVIKVMGEQSLIIPLTVELPGESDMLIDVPLFSQRDARWRNVQLGTSNVTIGGYGCVITCIAMLLSRYGYKETPLTVNEQAKAHHGFHSGAYFIWESVIRIWPEVHLLKKIDCRSTPAPIAQIDAELTAGRPVIVYVDFDHDSANGLQTHFVLLVGKNGDQDYWCNDPWTGEQVSLVEAYGTDDPKRPWMTNAGGVIAGVRFYSGIEE